MAALERIFSAFMVSASFSLFSGQIHEFETSDFF